MTSRTTRLSTVALPAEHGGWALVLEPIVLGLLLAPSFRGLFIGLASLSCFLARHPLKLALGDRRRRRRLPRTALAECIALIYAVTAVVLFAIAFRGGPRVVLLPLAFAAPLVLVQLSYDALGRGRKLLPEIAGAIGVGSIATAIALAGAWPAAAAFAVWAIVGGRNVPTILYLRTRLSARRRARQSSVITAVIVMQLVAIGIAVVLAWWKLVPVLVIVAFVILAVRAGMGLLSDQSPTTPKKLGITEFAFGAFTVMLVTLGYGLGW